MSNASAEEFATFHFLFEGEQPLLNCLKLEDISGMSMLDLGVGGGRTTEIFAPLVKDYVGVDYSPAMVAVCRRKFDGRIANSRFLEASACDLSAFDDSSFNFVLFSFNGIDYNTAEERVAALREIRRVLKPDGWFSFSHHNANWIKLHEFFQLHFPSPLRHPRTFLIEVAHQVPVQVRFRIANRSLSMKPILRKIRSEGCGYLHDVRTQLGLRNYFMSYERQVQQLREIGFERIRAYSANGIETDEAKELNGGSWIFYIARTPA